MSAHRPVEMKPLEPDVETRLARVRFALAETAVASTSGLWLVLSTFYRTMPGRLGHAQRVAALARAMASQLMPGADNLDNLERAALAHEIGCLVVPDLSGGLTADPATARARAQQQSAFSTEALWGVRFLEPAARLIRAMPEWVDGTGQPLGLAGEAIPLGARILGVADLFDVMDSACAEMGWPRDMAAVELVRCAGTRFDADVVAVALHVVESGPAHALPLVS